MAAAPQEAVNGYYDSKNDWLVFEWVNPETGKQQAIYDSSNKIKPMMHASLVLDAASGTYMYAYQVTNQAGAVQLLDDILVKHLAAVSGATSPDPQSDWLSAEYKGKSSWHWTKIRGAIRGIPAGQTVSGFSFKSKGLPTVVGVALTGERRAELTSPSPDDDTEEVQASFDRAYQKLQAQFPDKFVDGVQQKTIGPVDPPAIFNAASAIQNLIVLVNQSRVQGWIDNDGITNSLIVKLNNAASKVASDSKTTKNVLGAFLNDVSAQNGKHLSSEAFALLFFNGQYAVNHM